MILNQTLQVLHKNVIITRLKSLKIIFCLLFFNFFINVGLICCSLFFPFKKLLSHRIVNVISPYSIHLFPIRTGLLAVIFIIGNILLTNSSMIGKPWKALSHKIIKHLFLTSFSLLCSSFERTAYPSSRSSAYINMFFYFYIGEIVIIGVNILSTRDLLPT